MIQNILKHKKQIGIGIGLLGMTLAYPLFFKASGVHEKGGIKIVETEIVQKKSIQQTADFIGTVRSQHSTTLKAKSIGSFERLKNAGERVKKGELIAKVANYDVEASYKLCEKGEEVAKSLYEREEQMLKSGVSSKNAVEKQKALWIEAQKSKSWSKTDYEKINMYAPFDGIVGIYKAKEGAQVKVDDPLVDFYDPEKLIVEFDLPLEIIRQINDQSTVIINGSPYPLTHVQKMLDEETHMFPAFVHIKCDNCLIGTAADVTLIIQKKDDVIVVPHEAVFLREGNSFVYLVKDNKAELTAVETGLRDKEQVEITKGLEEGDILVITGTSRLYPNAEVKIHKEG